MSTTPQVSHSAPATPVSKVAGKKAFKVPADATNWIVVAISLLLLGGAVWNLVLALKPPAETAAATESTPTPSPSLPELKTNTVHVRVGNPVTTPSDIGKSNPFVGK